MNTKSMQYASGLSFTTIEDEFGRVTEICRGYNEVIIMNKSYKSDTKSIRRFSIPEFKELTELFNKVLVSR